MPRAIRLSSFIPLTVALALIAACGDTTTGTPSPEAIETAESVARSVTIEAPPSTTPEADEPGDELIQLDARVFGDGPRGVILVHMRPADQQSWFPFATTLASAYVSGTTLSTVAAPALGEQIVVERDGGTYSVARDVTAVSGAGPYTVTLNGQLGSAAAAGKAVRAAWGDSIHPSGPLHADVLPQPIIDWKVSRGWTA